MWVEQAAKMLGVSTRWVPFELHPDTPPHGADKPFTDAQWPAVRERLLGLAERVGLPMNPPRRNANSRLALETGELVREIAGDDASAAFHHAVSRAFFVDGANIADIELIAQHAASFGVDAVAVRDAWTTHRFAPAIDASMRAAAEAHVTGVPAFGWPGTRATSGMMEPDSIVAVLNSRKTQS
ncbi:MAG: DsbA family oxidoreductase [Candidatus Velthaea sp.]